MTTTNPQRTLAQRMTEGRIPVPEALHLAMSLADALRKLHDAGKAHGAVSPSSVSLTPTGLELIPSLGPPATVTPYTAPETLQGQPADPRSDIFSFGALVFEMLTGRRAFDGAGQTDLSLALCNSAPPPSGSPAVDRLMAGCLAKSPTARWQRMQKIIMELKLLTVAARRADSTPAARGVSDHALRAEIQQLEARLTARFTAQETAVSQIQKSAVDAVQALREHVAQVGAELKSVQQQPAPQVDMSAVMEQINARVNETISAVTQQISQLVDQKVDAASQRVNARVDENVLAASQRLTAQADEKLGAASHQVLAQMEEKLAAANQKFAAQADEKVATLTQQLSAKSDGAVEAVNQRIAAAEQNMEEIRKHFTTLQANVAGDLHDFEQHMKAQAGAIESARTAMSQTDDLVERVVEALELLQSSVLDQHEAVVN